MNPPKGFAAIFVIKDHPNVRQFIQEAHIWCTERFGPRTDYRKLFHHGRWEHNPEPYGAGSSVFIFQQMSDAIAFKLKFSEYLD